MKKMVMLAAVDRHWGIGCRNRLLFHIKQDMDDFRNKTLHNIVVMGRRTFESLPGSRPLPDRINIVLSREREICSRYGAGGSELIFMGSREEVLEYAENAQQAVFIIGGGEIYREFLNEASEAYITKVDAVREADTFFPNLDQLPEWNVVSKSGTGREAGCPDYEFWHYCKCEGDCQPR